MIGIQFQIPNQFGHFLFDILEGTGAEKYFWTIEEQEIYMPDHKSLFPATHLDGPEFLKRISEHEYYLIFAKILACQERGKHGETDTHSQFMDSSYETIILISDSTTVEIYSKNQAVLKQIETNAQRYSFGMVSLVTEENNSRTRFTTA